MYSRRFRLADFSGRKGYVDFSGRKGYVSFAGTLEGGGGGGGVSLRAFLMVVVLAGLLAVSPSSPVGAQLPHDPRLVGNLGQHSGSLHGLTLNDYAQAFTTGGNSAGYSLSSVDIRFSGLTDAAWASKLVVSVNADAGGSPGAELEVLTPSSTGAFSTGRSLRFAAPQGGVRLAADTTYFVVLDSTDQFGHTSDVLRINRLRSTRSTVEDSGGSAGWSLADMSLLRDRRDGGDTWRNFRQPLKIAVNGVAVGPPLVSGPEVVFVREGETVSVRLDLVREVTSRVPVTVSSPDVSRLKVNHPNVLLMGRRHQGYRDGASLGVTGRLVQSTVVPYTGRWVDTNGGGSAWSDQDRRAPSGSVSFGFDARDWEGYTSDAEPGLHKGYRVVEVTALPTGLADAKFELGFTSSDTSVGFPSVTVVVKRSLGLDPVFDPDPKSGFGCRERECLRVREGGTVEYTVKNFNIPAPGSPLTITPTGDGLTFSPSVVSWTHENHDELRTVTATAAHDDDARSDIRIVRHVFSDNWDTSGSLFKRLRHSRPKAESESMFNLAVVVDDDDLPDFATYGSQGREISQIEILSSPDSPGLSGVGRFWIKVDGPADCTGRTPGLCWDVLYIRLRTRNSDGTYTNAPMTATVWRADTPGISSDLLSLPYTKLAGPRNWFGVHIRPGDWNKLLQVQVALDPSLVNGSNGEYDITMSLARAISEPTAHRTLRIHYRPQLLGDTHVDPQTQQDQDQQDQPQQPEPVPYAADPQVVAAVQYLASQTHHGFAHVNRWQRALAALGVLDPADVAGGALTLAEARQNTQKYSSPVWNQVVAEIQAKQTHDTQQQDQQQDQPQQDQPQQDQPQQDQPQQDQPQQDQPQQDQPQQDQPQQPEPVPYAADPQVVAAVQYLASQTHHGFAHVNRWQRALAALGVLDPADIAGGALTLTEAKQNTQKYSSPVWHQVVAEIQAKQAHDTQ